MSYSIQERSETRFRDFHEKPSILIIDDDHDNCEVMSLFLSADYECDTAFDGEEAISLILGKQYSLILCDLMMPKVDGYTVTSCVSDLSPMTPVIVVSGVADIQSAIKAMRMGAFDYLVKPFEPDHLEVSVHRALAHHTLVREAHHNEIRLAAYAEELEKLNDGLSKALAELDSTYHSTISALATALETRNIETRGHSDRVVRYSLMLGRALGLDEIELKALELGALFHDIGKIGVEDRILLKPRNLTDEEWQEMRKHPLKGARILEEIPYLRNALPVVAQHHERWDGYGYPVGLVGEEIDLKARIFAVADAFDAITSNRPYDGPRSVEVAREELTRGAGKQFDPKVVKAFLDMPFGTWEPPTP